MKYSVSVPPDGNYLVAIGLEGVAESIERQISEMGEMGKKHGALEAVTFGFGEASCLLDCPPGLLPGLTEEYPNLLPEIQLLDLQMRGDAGEL